VEILHIEDIYT